jgi:sterol desaturase/sphingolipid hydroxylase (fatty acid hydroxylase superfamily)
VTTETGALLVPSLLLYASYFLEFCLRYFAVAGGLYWLLHVAFRRRWLAYRIQTAFPPSDDVRHEIRWSMANTACTGLSAIVTYQLVERGHTSMYLGLDDRGWAYFALSVVLLLVGYDTWIYWQHRWLHTPWMFRHIHWVHHRVGNPTTFATFAQHPAETLMGNVFFVLFVICVPVHPIALAAAGAYMFFYGILGHLGYEFYPKWAPRHRFFGWFNTATYHNMHHSLLGCNYSAWFIYWDRLMGTAHPSYLEVFDAVAARRSTAPEVVRAAPPQLHQAEV